MSQPHAPTLRDVAVRAGVHVATASRAMNDEQSHLVKEATLARVRAAAEALGYRKNAVAQSLRKGSTGTIGVVVADLANPFIVSVLRGVEYESARRDYVPLVTETHDDPESLRTVVTRMLRNRVDGIILSAVHTDHEDFVTELEGIVPVVLAVRGFEPTVDLDEPPRHLEVLQDDYLGARAAVNHLIQLGHRRIAQLTGNQRISSFIRRKESYDAVVGAHPDVVDLTSSTHALEASVAEGRRLTAELLRRKASNRPTAIFAHNDLMAVGAIDALREAGLRCPEDVSVVGYNDVPLIDHIAPPLTTVRLPGRELGRHSARLAFDALAGEGPQTARIVLAPEFVERRSTQAPAS